ITPSTASEHLSALVGGGLVRVRKSGRHRYYELTDTDIAEALEMVGRLCPSTGVESLRQARDRSALALARTCYDHLAGRLGVLLYDAMVANEWIQDGSLEVTDAGRAGLAELDIDVTELAKGRRRLTRECLDWTERRTHLAGALGAALAGSLLTRKWVLRKRGGRGLRITTAGADGLQSTFGLDATTWVVP
ncbi:MAG: helix-turn-helix domain-containing protein, partial [Nocardioidaceae bacterium]